MPTSMAATNTKINSIMISGYQYSNLELSGEFRRGIFGAKVKVNDPNLTTDVHLDGKIKNGFPGLSGKITIDRADVRGLGFSKDSMILTGFIDIDTLNTDPVNFIASVNVNKVFLHSGGKSVPVDSVVIKANSNKEGTELLRKVYMKPQQITKDMKE